MRTRIFGRTGLTVPVLGFGCGAVGGLMVRGEPADQERAVALAVERGVTFFDTAPAYGEGRSEANLGRVLAHLQPRITLATKFTIRPADRERVADALTESMTASLRRLGREQVDLFQLHNLIASDGRPGSLSPAFVLGDVVPALASLRGQGRLRFTGFTGVGATADILEVVDSGAFDSIQVPYNLLNPSAGRQFSPGMVGQDFGQVLRRAKASDMGSIGIRALAGGALSGEVARHPVGMAEVGPIGTGSDYTADVTAAHRFEPLVRAGHAGSLVEAALRFAIGTGGPSTVLVGVSTLEQFAFALDAVEKGPLPPDALVLARQTWS